MPAWSRAPLAVAVVALLLIVGPAIAAATAALPATATERGTSTVESTAPFESNTTYQIDMRESGNAKWSITVSTPLTNDSQRDGFDVVADRFEQGEFLSVAPFRESSNHISDATGRPMQITNVSRSVNTTSDRGRLVLSFTWTNFGYREGEQLYVDDVFQTDDRLLVSLDERETLILTRPDGYQFNSASTNIQDGVLRWDGPYTFGSNEPYVSFSPIPPAETTPNDSSDSMGTMLYALVGLVFLGSIASIAYVVRRKDRALLSSDSSTDETDTAADPGSTAQQADTESTAVASDVDGDDEPGADDATPDAEPAPDEVDGEDEPATDEPDRAEADEDAAPDEPDVEDEQSGPDAVPISEELLSDEERVERLLKQNGGRMKQANIVSETGWSNAKVSQLLSAMDEAGRIEKLRIGRENLISFPEEDSGETDS